MDFFYFNTINSRNNKRKIIITKDRIKKSFLFISSLLLEHTYKIIDKKSRETSISFDALIANANIEQLKQYREYLVYFKSINHPIQENGFSLTENQVDIRKPMKKHKLLKIELKSNKHNNGATNQ